MELSEIAATAKAMTDKKFGDELSSHVSLTADDIKELTPTSIDQKHLADLLHAVKSATDANDFQTRIAGKAADWAKPIFGIVKKAVF